MYTLVENDIEPGYEFSGADMKEFDKRWDDYLSGKTKPYTLEETISKVKLHRKNRKKNGI